MARSYRCIHCGYNLRGLPRTGRCPECGEPVADSTDGDALRSSAPVWLQAIARGAGLLYAGCIVVAASWMFLLLFFLVISTGPTVAKLAGWIGAAVRFVASLLFLTGVMLVTRQEPRVTYIEAQTAWRPLSRWCVALAVVVVFAEWIVNSGLFSLPSVGVWANLESTVRGVRAIVICAFVICMTRYGGQLAGRIPDPDLAIQARTRGTGYVVCYILLGVLGVFGAALSPGGLGPSPSPTVIGIVVSLGSCASLFAGLGVLAFGVGLVFVTAKMRRALRKCLAETANDDASQGA